MLAGGERGTTKGFSACELHDASRADVGWIPLFQPEKQHAFVPLPRLVYDRIMDYEKISGEIRMSLTRPAWF